MYTESGVMTEINGAFCKRMTLYVNLAELMHTVEMSSRLFMY